MPNAFSLLQSAQTCSHVSSVAPGEIVPSNTDLIVCGVASSRTHTVNIFSNCNSSANHATSPSEMRVTQLQGPPAGCSALLVNNKEGVVLVGGVDGSLLYFQANAALHGQQTAQRVLLEAPAEQNNCSVSSISLSSTNVIAAGAGRYIHLLALADGKLVQRLGPLPCEVLHTAWLGPCSLIAGCAAGLFLWGDIPGLSDGQQAENSSGASSVPGRPLPSHPDVIYSSFAISTRGGHAAASSSNKKEVLVWRNHGKSAGGNKHTALHSVEPIQLKGYTQEVDTLAWDGEGRMLATAGGDSITLWDFHRPQADGQPMKCMAVSGHEKGRQITCLDFDLANEYLVSGGDDCNVAVYPITWLKTCRPGQEVPPSVRLQLVGIPRTRLCFVRWVPSIPDQVLVVTASGILLLLCTDRTAWRERTQQQCPLKVSLAVDGMPPVQQEQIKQQIERLTLGGNGKNTLARPIAMGRGQLRGGPFGGGPFGGRRGPGAHGGGAPYQPNGIIAHSPRSGIGNQHPYDHHRGPGGSPAEGPGPRGGAGPASAFAAGAQGHVAVVPAPFPQQGGMEKGGPTGGPRGGPGGPGGPRGPAASATSHPSAMPARMSGRDPRVSGNSVRSYNSGTGGHGGRGPHGGPGGPPQRSSSPARSASSRDSSSQHTGPHLARTSSSSNNQGVPPYPGMPGMPAWGPMGGPMTGIPYPTAIPFAGAHMPPGVMPQMMPYYMSPVGAMMAPTAVDEKGMPAGSPAGGPGPRGPPMAAYPMAMPGMYPPTMMPMGMHPAYAANPQMQRHMMAIQAQYMQQQQAFAAAMMQQQQAAMAQPSQAAAQGATQGPSQGLSQNTAQGPNTPAANAGPQPNGQHPPAAGAAAAGGPRPKGPPEAAHRGAPGGAPGTPSSGGPGRTQSGMRAPRRPDHATNGPTAGPRAGPQGAHGPQMPIGPPIGAHGPLQGNSAMQTPAGNRDTPPRMPGPIGGPRPRGPPFNRSTNTSFAHTENTLYVGNLTPQVTEATLYETFEHFGPLKAVQIIRDKVAHSPRGFGFVTFEHNDDAMRALEEVNDRLMYGPYDGRSLKVAQSTKGLQHQQRQ